MITQSAVAFDEVGYPDGLRWSVHLIEIAADEGLRVRRVDRGLGPVREDVVGRPRRLFGLQGQFVVGSLLLLLVHPLLLDADQVFEDVVLYQIHTHRCHRFAHLLRRPDHCHRLRFINVARLVICRRVLHETDPLALVNF